jgi:hypothetical protein
MRTSQDAPQSGIYATECCSVEATFLQNDTLTRCPRCEALCNWDFVESTVLADQLVA